MEKRILEADRAGLQVGHPRHRGQGQRPAPRHLREGRRPRTGPGTGAGGSSTPSTCGRRTSRGSASSASSPPSSPITPSTTAAGPRSKIGQGARPDDLRVQVPSRGRERRSPSARTGRSPRSTPSSGIYAAVTRATLDGKNPGGWVRRGEDLRRGGRPGLHDRRRLTPNSPRRTRAPSSRASWPTSSSSTAISSPQRRRTSRGPRS